MEVVSAGAITGARAAYEIHGLGNNQENQGLGKSTINATRQQYLDNSRVPLTSLPTDRVEPGEYGQTPQQRSHEREEGSVSAQSKFKIGSEIGSHQTVPGNRLQNGNPSHADGEEIPENMYRPEKYDAEGWIHREKLAKIENEELQAAGINLAKARTRSRDALRTASRDRLRTDFAASELNAKEEKKRKVSSPIPVRREEGEDMTERENWDLRSPEEIAVEQTVASSYITPVSRRSGSKIPVLSPNMQSVSPEGLERGTSLQHRKRTMSDSISNEDGLISQKLRTANPNGNDDVGDAAPGTLRKTSSPTKTRQKSISNGPTPPLTAKSSVPRKTSTTKQPTVPPNGRPRTRGNDSERPRTAVNPPEGDPPWLADMYKPDPRLPPDQQLIPTLAKKQRQMQWEENGMIPKTYDREFTALAVHDNADAEASIAQPVEPELPIERPEDSEAWPLKPLPSIHNSKDAIPKPATNNTAPTTGGYSTMPKVSSPPMSITSPKIGSGPTTNVGPPSIHPPMTRQTSAPQQQQVQKTQSRPQMDDDDEKIQKKGCGCCIVM